MSCFILKTSLLCLIITGCSGHLSSDISNGNQGYADSQVVGTWKITAYVSSAPYDWNGDGRPETDIFSTWNSCQQDNLFQFHPDKTGQFKVSCLLSGPGTWQIINSIFLYYTRTGQIPEAEKIVSMTSAEFKTVQEVTVYTGQNLTLTKTWRRQ